MATTMDRFTPSRAPVKRVKSVQFGVWNPEEIVSAAERWNTQNTRQAYLHICLDHRHHLMQHTQKNVCCLYWMCTVAAAFIPERLPATVPCLCTTLCMVQKKYSVCHVEAAELFEKGVAKSGGLSDPRMGTMDKFGGICTTDGANMHDCPGYFGHIELAQPVYHCK